MNKIERDRKLVEFLDSLPDEVNDESSIAVLDARLTALEATNQELQGDINFLREKVVSIEAVNQSLLGRVQYLEVATSNLIKDQIEEFQEERDHNGYLKYPLSQDLLGLMSDLVASGHCRSLKDSYVKALSIELNNFK